jgi:homoserine O-acetyltransferase
MSATLTLPPAADLFLSAEPLALERGGELPAVELSYELVGPARAHDDGDEYDRRAGAVPCVVVQGGISAHPHVASSPRDPTPGWWSRIVGDGLALDTTRVRVLSLEFLGKRQDAVVSSGDQARATARLLDSLGIARLHAFVGASYGGMVALKFGELFPERVGQIVAISAPDRSSTFATAWRALQRELLAFGARHDEREGVALARAFAMLSYRSPQELEERFAGDARADGETLRFPVEEWLLGKGREFATRFEAGAYSRLSRAIDLHRCDVTRISASTTLIGADPDQIVPFEQLRAVAAKFATPPRLERIASRFGHDAFLKEPAALGALLTEALA